MASRDSKSRLDPGDFAAAPGAEEENVMRRGSSTAPAVTAGCEGTGRGVTNSAVPPVAGEHGTESSYSIMNNTFRVDARYNSLKAIGKGSFGIVCSAFDEKQAKRVAIKKIHPMAQHFVDAKHVLREIRLMRYLGSHPNIVSLEDLFVSEYHDELYIVMELLDSDLHRIIQSTQVLGDAHHRYFMFQILKGVKFLHDNRIIHRDLKPGNVLVTKDCQLRITDFGLARLRPMGRGADPDDEVDHPMTEHVVTRWYRPPELMLCPDGLYGYAVDLWSIGCIFAELLGRQPLFPGKNFMDQLTLIFNVVGSPQPREVGHIRNSQAKRFLDSMRDRVKVPFTDLFPSATDQAVDLLEELLVFDPPGRLSVDEALNHPYFQPLRRGDVVPDPEVAPGFEFDFESEPLCRVQLKKIILREVESFQRAQRKRDRRARTTAALSEASVSATAVVSANAANTASCTSNSNATAAGSGKSTVNESSDSITSGSTGRSNSIASTISAATVDNASNTTEEKQQRHQHQHQHQWEKRKKIQGAVAAAGKREEKAPISAVSSVQAASEATTVRAGLGSFKNVSQSHWGQTAGAPPHDNHAIGGVLRPSSPAEPMEDEGHTSVQTSSETAEAQSPGRPPVAQGHGVAGCGRKKSNEGGSGNVQGWRKGSSMGGAPASDSRWWEGGKPSTNSSTNAYYRQHIHQPHYHHHHHQQQQQEQQQAPYGGEDKAHHQRYHPRASNSSSNKWSASAKRGEGLESPARTCRLSVNSTGGVAAAGEACDVGARGGVLHRVEGRMSTGRGGGGLPGAGWESARAGGVCVGGNFQSKPQHRYQQVYRGHRQKQQQQQQQQPAQQVWVTKPAALQEVEDRFHYINYLNVDRVRYGRRPHNDLSDPSAVMRAPQR